MAGLLDRHAIILERAPVGRILSPFEQPHLAATGFDHPGIAHPVDRGALGAGQGVDLAEGAGAPAVLAEPVVAEQGVGVEAAAVGVG